MGKKKKSDAFPFEASLKKLEEIVKKLEEEELPLETSLTLFSEGQRLAKVCEEQLKAAENRIRLLMEDDSGEIEERDFEAAKDDEPSDGDKVSPVSAQPETATREDDIPF